MAFDFGAWLQKAMEEKGEGGTSLYSPETLQDVVALALISGGEPLTGLPPPVAKILGSFFIRAGVTGAADPKQALEAYFAQHPVPPALTESLQRELKRNPGMQSLRIGAIRG